MFFKNPYLEAHHYAMIFYQFFKLRKNFSIYAFHHRKLTQTSDDISNITFFLFLHFQLSIYNRLTLLLLICLVSTVEEKGILWENKNFIKVYEKIMENLENMNPDSLNLLTKTLGMRRISGGNNIMIEQLFNGICDLLQKDKNILFFNEYQLFYFLKNLNLLKTYWQSSKSCRSIT